MGTTGVVGIVKAGTSDRAIGLRADMDALPMQEFNTFATPADTPARCTPAAMMATPPCCWRRPSIFRPAP
jgi:metal-dependent amidase/aminoacylase/carboxypeptidase family protein